MQSFDIHKRRRSMAPAAVANDEKSGLGLQLLPFVDEQALFPTRKFARGFMFLLRKAQP